MSDFYRYLPEVDVHVLDCAGRVDLAIGLERLQVLQRRLAERPPVDGVAKLLVDFRNTVWESVDDHMKLSRVTRDEFGLRPDNFAVRVAFVHAGRTGGDADNERWFSSREAALDWLVGSA